MVDYVLKRKGKKVLVRVILVIMTSLAMLVLAFNIFIGLRYDINVLRGRYFELPGEGVKEVNFYIQAHADAGEEIIAQPYFAFISGRRLAEEYSEHFIWKIMYWNETLVEKREGQATAMFGELAEGISEKRIPIVVLDLEQTATIPALREAIVKNYEALLDYDIRSRSFTFRLMVPKGE
jgi:hypothetical protein